MPGADIPEDGYGLVDWTNGTDNWRDQDASWLQERGVIRFANATTRDAALGLTPAPGSVVYNNGASAIQWADSSSVWHTVLSPVYLTYSETSTYLTFALGGNAAPLTVKENTVELGANAALVVGASSLLVKTGANTTTLTTDSNGLVASHNVKAATFSSTGLATLNTLSVTSTSTFNGLLEATSGLTVSGGTAQFGAVTSTGITVSSGTVSAATLTSTGNISATSGYVQGGTAKIATSGGAQLSSTGGAGTVTLTTSPTDSVAMSGKAFTMKTQTVGAVAVNIAGVYFGSDPGVANVPEGTLWIDTGLV